MRIRVVLHYLSLFLMGLAGVMLLPLIFSIYYKEGDTIPFLISMAITLSVAGLLWLVASHHEKKISHREALLLVTGVWVSAALLGALPYRLAGTFPGYLDAYFEAMSGFSTTGASVLSAISAQPHGILIWRSLTQWLGGMGIVMLFVGMFPIMGVGAAHLAESEMPGPKDQRLTARMRDTARILWQLYLGLTIIEVLLLMFAGLSFFDALANTFGTMPTGGFSPKDLSIAAYNNAYVEIIIIVFMTLAGSNFQLYYFLLWKRKFKAVLADRELRYYLLILAGAGLLIALNLLMNMGFPTVTALRYAIFQVVSIQTTTGFATTDFAVWPAFSRLALLVLMVIGASASSTGGALKVVRIVVLVKYAFRQVSLVFNPRKVQPLKLAGKVLSDKVISEILGLSILYFALLVIGSLLMSLFGLDPITAISATVASLGNVGPGLGAVGPLANYSFIPDLGKLLLTMLMLIGRLELWAVLVIFTSAFWRWRGRPSANSSL